VNQPVAAASPGCAATGEKVYVLTDGGHDLRWSACANLPDQVSRFYPLVIRSRHLCLGTQS